jgi:hypothetical protein
LATTRSRATLQQLQHRFRVGPELLEGLAFEAWNNRCDEPLRLAHLDYGHDRVILLESGKGPARVKGVKGL